MKLACTDRQGHIIIVLKRKKGKTFFIGKPRNKRTVCSMFNREFNNTFLLIADNPGTIASKWLASPITMTSKVKEELEMIAGIKNNKIVNKYENASQAPEGVELVAGIDDLSGRSLKSLNALYKKLTDSEDKFATVEEASAAVWSAIEEYEVPVKEVKEKKIREKQELIELPKHISKSSVITAVAENPKRDGSAAYTRFALYQTGMTVGQFCEAGGTLLDVRFDAAREFITVDFVEEEAAEKPKKEKKAKKSKEQPEE